MHEYEDLFDEEYDIWQEEERQKQEDYFDNHSDELYEQYVNDYYQSLEDKNMFVLIYNTHLQIFLSICVLLYSHLDF